jgi:hypothetical protein
MYHLSTYFLFAILCVAAIVPSYKTSAQNTNKDSARYLSVPGPANQDTTKYATFYLMRPDNDIARNKWLGIYFDDTLIVRVDDDYRYVIRYARMGNIHVWSKAYADPSSLSLNAEPGKKYYIKMDMEPGGKIGNPKLTQLEEKDGEETFNKIKNPPLYVYDPDPFTNSKYIWPSSSKTGYEHMMFSLPLSTRHYFVSSLEGFKFTYFNKSVSPTFTEIDGVYAGKINLSDKEEFEKFAKKQINNLKKGFKKSETLKEMTEDTLFSNADYISSVYFVTEDSKASLPAGGKAPLLELRQYSSLLYKKDLKTGKGDFYSIYFSERGLPQELHTKEEIRFKIQLLLSSCEFGDF